MKFFTEILGDPTLKVELANFGMSGAPKHHVLDNAGFRHACAKGDVTTSGPGVIHTAGSDRDTPSTFLEN
jgi:hypothetical protein